MAIPGFDMSLLKREENRALLAKLPEPKIVWGYFLMCTETPRPSGHLEQIRERVMAVGRAAKLDVAVDAVGNVRIRKPATAGHEKALKVCVQCHLDMVPTKSSSVEHDFTKDPIKPVLEGDFVKAQGTTLGGDDGIGIATCLALLTQPGLQHGPLECLFTVDEETTMEGAAQLAPYPFLEALACINVDSEDANAICIGCAGGLEKKLQLPVTRHPSWPAAHANHVLLNVTVDGLLGGHTGVDIHRGRANALQLIAKLLARAREQHIDVLLLAIKGGNASNAIPSECSAQVFVPKEQQAAFTDCVHSFFALAKDEFRITESKVEEAKAPEKPVVHPAKLQCAVSAADHKHAAADCAAPAPCTSESTQKLLDLILCAPHGPQRMSAEVCGEVETSVACSRLTLTATPTDGNKDEAMLGFLARSSSDSQMFDVGRKLEALARLAGAKVTPSQNFFSGWQPNSRSALLAQTSAAHQQLFHADARVYCVHAGLECGQIQGHYPKMECVSIGPTVTGAHTTDEKLQVSSVAPFYDWTARTVQLLTAVPHPAN